jgi:hypothetical protein
LLADASERTESHFFSAPIAASLNEVGVNSPHTEGIALIAKTSLRQAEQRKYLTEEFVCFTFEELLCVKQAKIKIRAPFFD